MWRRLDNRRHGGSVQIERKDTVIGSEETLYLSTCPNTTVNVRGHLEGMIDMTGPV